MNPIKLNEIPVEIMKYVGNIHSITFPRQGHGDFTIDNVLIQDGKITGIIDWGSAAFGDPRFDVALAIRPKPNAFQKAIDKEIFFDGYGEKGIDERSYDYYVNGLCEFF